MFIILLLVAGALVFTIWLTNWVLSKAEGPQAMRDVAAGKGNGYPVGVGWDPVTGLGVPQAEKLRKIVMALP